MLMKFTGKFRPALSSSFIRRPLVSVANRSFSTPYLYHQTREGRPDADVLRRKDQLVHPPWFLSQYQQLWSSGNTSTVFHVEFVVLLLRLCSYASQFLPSPSHPIDGIRSMLLSDIRTLCNDVAEKLANICAQLDPRGSLLRVQHLAFLGLRLQCEGQNMAFWEVLNKASLVAQRIGLHRNHTAYMPEMHGLEQEMRRRVWCNLYIWDRYVILVSLADAVAHTVCCSDKTVS